MIISCLLYDIYNVAIIILFRCFAQILLGVVFVFVVIILGIFAALKGSPTLKVRKELHLKHFSLYFGVPSGVMDFPSLYSISTFSNGYCHNKT